MGYIQFGIGTFFGALFMWLVVTIVMQYVKAEGSTWDKILASGKGSATLVWSKLVATVSAALLFLADAAQVFDLPQVKEFLTSMQVNTQTIAAIGLVFAVITFIARKRTMPEEG